MRLPEVSIESLDGQMLAPEMKLFLAFLLLFLASCTTIDFSANASHPTGFVPPQRIPPPTAIYVPLRIQFSQLLASHSLGSLRFSSGRKLPHGFNALALKVINNPELSEGLREKLHERFDKIQKIKSEMNAARLELLFCKLFSDTEKSVQDHWMRVYRDRRKTYNQSSFNLFFHSYSKLLPLMPQDIPDFPPFRASDKLINRLGTLDDRLSIAHAALHLAELAIGILPDGEKFQEHRDEWSSRIAIDEFLFDEALQALFCSSSPGMKPRPPRRPRN